MITVVKNKRKKKERKKIHQLGKIRTQDTALSSCPQSLPTGYEGFLEQMMWECFFKQNWGHHHRKHMWHPKWFNTRNMFKETCKMTHANQGRSQYFSKGGGGVIIWGSTTIYGLYRCSPSCISGLRRIIAAWRSRWLKYFTKKQI